MRAALFAAAATILVLSACAVEEPAPAVQAPESSSAKQTTDAAATSPPGSGEESQKPAGEKKTVEIVNFIFEPGKLTVPAGTTITWTQQDSSLHTVDFEDGEKSDDMDKGDSYSRTFDEPGEYPYICFYHPRMTGTVTVN